MTSQSPGLQEPVGPGKSATIVLVALAFLALVFFGQHLGPWLLIFAVGSAYFLPTIVAVHRRAAVQGTIVVLNLLLGWTVIGWVVALAMAFGPTRP